MYLNRVDLNIIKSKLEHSQETWEQAARAQRIQGELHCAIAVLKIAITEFYSSRKKKQGGGKEWKKLDVEGKTFDVASA